jgi:hypothetical protein
VTTLRGTIRSTETREAEGYATSVVAAKEAAVAALDLDGFALTQTNAVESKATGETTIRATARSTATREHEASGPNYTAALAAYRDSVPDGWEAQHVWVVAE